MSAASALTAAELLDRRPELTTVDGFGQTAVVVPIAEWLPVAVDAYGLGYLLFDWLGAEDAGRPGQAGAAVVITLHVVDPDSRSGLQLCTELPNAAALPSVARVWPGAAWHEREVAEMYGGRLDGHPGPDRVLLAPGFTAHPLRKDFVLAARVAQPWPGRLEPGESGGSDDSRPGARRRRAVPPGLPDDGWLR